MINKKSKRIVTRSTQEIIKSHNQHANEKILSNVQKTANERLHQRRKNLKQVPYALQIDVKKYPDPNNKILTKSKQNILKQNESKIINSNQSINLGQNKIIKSLITTNQQLQDNKIYKKETNTNKIGKLTNIQKNKIYVYKPVDIKKNINRSTSNKKRIAIIFRGLAECKGYMHQHTNKLINVDYKKSLDNYRKYLFENNDIDIFFHTYNTPSLNKNELINNLNPKQYEITDPLSNIFTFEPSGKMASLMNTLLRALNVYLNYVKINNVKYDYVIVTRFDLLFKRKVSGLALDPSKFMISCMCETDNLCDDNFFVMNMNDVETFANIINKHKMNKEYSLHSIYKRIRETFGNRLKILLSGRYIIMNGTPLYSIVR